MGKIKNYIVHSALLFLIVFISCDNADAPLRVSVGDNYGGGIVAYIFQPGDHGYVPGEVHGLIAAEEDQSAGTWWAIPAYQSVSVGGTDSVIGSGSANTNRIISLNGTGASYAAGAARIFNGGGYTDWFLPSKDELDKIHESRALIGGFSSKYYWSSTECGNGNAWDQEFYPEETPYNVYNDAKGSTSVKVRAARNF